MIKARNKTVMIPLHGKCGEGKYAVVDAADMLVAMSRQWTYQHGKLVVSTSRVNGKLITVCLHTLIAGAKTGKVVDHIDSDPLNCRRNNLRHITRSELCKKYARRRQ